MAMTHDQRLLATGLVPCVALSAAAFLVVPWFRNMFTTVGLVGTWTPRPYRLLLATYRWWGVTALVTLLLWRFWPSADRRGVVASQFGLWCFIVLLVFGTVGCFAPLFALAEPR